MASKVANISDLIQRCASSCLTNPIVSATTRPNGGIQTIGDAMIQEEEEEEESIEEEEVESIVRIWEEEEGIRNDDGNNNNSNKKCGGGIMEMRRVKKEMEGLMSEVFDTVSSVKRAYVSLQEAHCPWDPDRMRAADASVVAELRRLGRLRDRFRRGAGAAAAAPPLIMRRVVVAPYEAALQDLKKELKAKEAEVQNLKDKLLRTTTPRSGSGPGKKMGRLHSTTTSRVGCITGLGQ